MIFIKNITKLSLLAFTAIVGVFVISSCNKNFPEGDKLRTDYPNDTLNVSGSSEKKVLYLVIDGARGSEVDTLKPANIQELTKTGVYTWRAVSGYNPADTTTLSAWATMLTGVNSYKHQITNNYNNANLDDYPSVVTRVKSLHPNYKVASYASSPLFNQELTKKADINTVFANDDAAVANALIAELKSDEAIKLLIGQFNSTAIAGNAYGYSYRVPQYAAAIQKVDTYIGNIVEALMQRPNFSGEDWLIVVSSSTNGTVDYNVGDSSSSYDDTRKNSFVILNNPRFNSKFVPYPASTKGLSFYKDTTLHFEGIGSSGVNASVPNTDGVADLKKGSALTIEAKVKFIKDPLPISGDYLNILNNLDGSSGWRLMYDKYAGNNNFYFSANGAYGAFDARSKNIMADNKWHSVVMVLDWTASETGFYFTTYVDGELNSSNRVVNPGNKVGNNAPLYIGARNVGHAGNSYIDQYITDVRIWNVALPRDFIQQVFCKTEISPNSPYYSNLQMFYKVSKGVIKDYSMYHRPNGTIYDPSNIAKWEPINEVSNAVCPPPDNNFYKATPNGVDIPLHIYQWLGIIPAPSWRLEGIYWPNVYNDVVLPENF